MTFLFRADLKIFFHSHLLVWLTDKIHLSQIDDLVRAEIPKREEDPLLFDIITKQMVHGPCGSLNPGCVCMKDGKCSKKYPKPFVSETQLSEDSYPTYRRRSPEEGGETWQQEMPLWIG